jgi:hypothetical protein
MSTSKFALGLLAAVVMFAGVVGLFSSHTSAQQTRVIHLAQGWNSVAWTGEKQSASAALASLGDAVSVAYGYNNDSQSFTLHAIGRPEISTLTDFEPEQSYWVLALRSADWSVPGPAVPSCPTTTPRPTTTPCPAGTPCPACPTPENVMDELCSWKRPSLEWWRIVLDVDVALGFDASNARDAISDYETFISQNCQGLGFDVIPSSGMSSTCWFAGEVKGESSYTLILADFLSPGEEQALREAVDRLDTFADKYCR